MFDQKLAVKGKKKLGTRDRETGNAKNEEASGRGTSDETGGDRGARSDDSESWKRRGMKEQGKNLCT